TMYAALERAVREAPERGVRCLVVTGAEPAFCSGDDVRQVMGGGQEGKAPAVTPGGREPRLTPACQALRYTDTPVIAPVNGAAGGWGIAGPGGASGPLHRRRGHCRGERCRRRLGHGAVGDGRYPRGQ